MLREQLQLAQNGGGKRNLLIGSGGGEDDLDGLLEAGYLCSNCGGRGGKGKRKYWAGWRGFESDEEEEDYDNDDGGGELVAALRGLGRDSSGKYIFDETRVRKVVKRMGREARGRLIQIILDASHPGDTSLQLLLLQNTSRSTFDVLGNLSQPLALRVLLYFPVTDVVLRLTLVSKKWHKVIHHLYLLAISVLPPHPYRPRSHPTSPSASERIRRRRLVSIIQVFASFAEESPRGLAQSVLFLQGHTGHVTTLTLRGRRLISGSYDESIRFWELPERGVGVGMSRAAMAIESAAAVGGGVGAGGAGGESVSVKEALKAAECKKVLRVGRVVSCVDWLIEEEVFVVGFHDVGRVHLFSSLTYTPLQQLAGHLNGIRAVALTSKNLVSAGADKALVCWDWRAGTKIVRFGQQTTVNIGVQLIAGATKEEGERVCATKSVILHLQWQEDSVSSNGTDGTNANNTNDKKSANSIKSPTSATGSSSSSIKSPNAIARSPSVLSLASTATSSALRDSFSFPYFFDCRYTRLTLAVDIVFFCRRIWSSTSTSRGGRLSVSGRQTPSTPNSMLSPRSGTATPSTPGFGLGLGSSVRVGQRAAILTAPPKLVALVETPDVAVGAVDPRKKRVVTATRFSSRAGADRRIFMSIHQDKPSSKSKKPESGSAANDGDDSDNSDSDSDLHHIFADSLGGSGTGTGGSYVPYSGVEIDTNCTPVTGAWSALADAESLGIPGGGLNGSEKNPMSMQMSHEEVVVGCADGTIYVMNFVGYEYQKPRLNVEDAHGGHGEGVEDDEDDDSDESKGSGSE
ncbi:hypothetical protein BT96DRAFT_998680 [Gymnopus androsaceus JB14]|uniref:WD40 repeat-like protein n=1 Tax=Gymnopus androsaceus JB14 TaxID=1447944 RepID=A0A6A4H7L3_9AGAR|nr:hypothetical protein BT96DRAFT_998680 [Gymnopus androsaceus JB14]